MDIYGHPGEIRPEGRQLWQDLGVSRTPIHVPRRGIRVSRKSKREVIEMMSVWAAIECMAARLATTRVTRADLVALRALVDALKDDPSAELSEYSRARIAFHKAFTRQSRIELMTSLTETLFIRTRAVRAVTMTRDNRSQCSIADHRAIIAARNADEAEPLGREHKLGLAAYVEKHGDFLDGPMQPVVEENRRRAA